MPAWPMVASRAFRAKDIQYSSVCLYLQNAEAQNARGSQNVGSYLKQDAKDTKISPRVYDVVVEPRHVFMRASSSFAIYF